MKIPYRTNLAIVLLLLSAWASSGLAALGRGADEGAARARPVPTASDADNLLDESIAPVTPATQVPDGVVSGRNLYFVPSDHDASITCLFLMNTTVTAQDVFIQGYTLTGALNLAQTINVPAKATVRACSDPLAGVPPPSWASVVVINFTDFSNYARLVLPAGVHIDGFIATGPAFDPNAPGKMLKLRFDHDTGVSSVLTVAPQDSNGTATCINLYNTGAVQRTVLLRGFDLAGVAVYSQDLILAAGAMTRACSDALVASPPPSWVGTVTTNFTDFVTRLELTLPPLVKVDGFVTWNLATGTVDPRSTTDELMELRFSSDQLFADGFEASTP